MQMNAGKSQKTVGCLIERHFHVCVDRADGNAPNEATIRGEKVEPGQILGVTAPVGIFLWLLFIWFPLFWYPNLTGSDRAAPIGLISSGIWG